ncbi:MAG: MBL fold metallo-hydrolase [Planctomycetota bacterium]
MKASLQFLGAARQVTGSKHFLRAPDLSVLLDCGMVQGPRRLANRVNRDLPLSHNEVDAVLLSHAHIDHSGSLPRLVRLGYRGPIHCTEATAALLEILLPDSAHLQQSDALYLRKRGKRFEPAYDMADVDQTLRQIVPWQYDQSFEVGRGVDAHFLDAGHILGSAQVVLDLEDGGETLRIGFTGDLGRKDTPILRDPAPCPLRRGADRIHLRGPRAPRSGRALPRGARVLPAPARQAGAHPDPRLLRGPYAEHPLDAQPHAARGRDRAGADLRRFALEQ